MPFVVGENVGPYRIIEKLGRGGMATVFKSYHAALDRYVAIKALHPAFMEDPNFLARFQREARVVAKLEHPNIVPIYDFAEHEGRPYLVMKFIEGETLKARITREAIPQDQIILIVEAVGAGLTYAHGQGILHRDVKPSNVLLAEDGRFYLADFGLARIAQAGESTLSGDMMLGTPQYISPEQAMGISELDEGTDIYSFGVMLYELTVGQVPFSADTPFSIIHDHIYTPLPLPRKVNANVTEDIERVLLKSLAKERTDRFGDIASLVRSFSQALREAGPNISINTESAATIPPTTGGEAAALLGDRLRDTSTALMPEGVETPILSSEGAQRKKTFLQRLRWWQIALVSLALIFCCLLTLAVIDNRQKQQQADVPAIQATIVADEEPTQNPEVIKADDPVALAQQKVNENPENPFAYIDLAIALFDAGEPREADAVLTKAVDLGKGDFEVNQTAAKLWLEQEAYTSAAKMYLELARQNSDRFDEWDWIHFHKSAYIASSFPGASDAIPIPGVAEVDELFERVLKARNLLFNETPEQAQGTLDEIFASGASSPEAELAQAEIYNAQGRTRDAAEILEVLLKSDETPAWIKDFINEAIYDFRQSAITPEAMSIAEARAGAEANPNDPWAQLDLVEALLAAGEFDQVEAEMQKAMEISPEDPAVYLRAGNILTKYNINLYAVGMYLTAANLPGAPSYEEVSGQIAEAMYLSSVGADAITHLETLETDLDPLMMEIARIRNTLHNGDKEVAKYKLQGLREQYGDAPEVLLLEAEIISIFGDDEAATEQWNALVEDEGAPFWVRRQARILIAKFGQ